MICTEHTYYLLVPATMVEAWGGKVDMVPASQDRAPAGVGTQPHLNLLLQGHLGSGLTKLRCCSLLYNPRHFV